ncbi:DUF58 domain-containing protein [Synechococcales cyanobacterium C]|uniref:DUF58 domain-containing protein n=1 Tax=Petrachloros mirabilis ULC683 TaxID=2781853 RepID=A0A8K2A974_9CYAN|nr:DUF58 domain-containing protein [Petrachloros mirabilis]NCJ07929.1 DUF58 domain-containing protein [Petrachloros mirabilis ULC683]
MNTSSFVEQPQPGTLPTVQPTPVQPTRAHPLPTLRLYGLLSLGLLLPLLLTWLHGMTQWGLWLVLVAFNLGVLSLAAWDFSQSQRWQLAIQRHCDSRLSIGRENAVHLFVQVLGHPDGVTQTLLKIRDGVPTAFQVDHDTLTASLQPRTETELIYHVFPPRRGAFVWASLGLRLQSPWGLVQRAWRLPLPTEVEVYPDLIGLRLLSVRLSLEATGSLRRRRHALGGTEFSELREYNSGDDVRLIDWKATARRGHPLIRLLEPERDQPLIILLDRGRLMTAQVAGLKRFDWALNATLSLAMAGLRRGDRVGVAVFDQSVHTWVGPQSGASHLATILAKLYNLEPVQTESNYVEVASRVLGQYTRRALVVLLTDVVDAIASSELLTAMTQLTPRFLPLCVTLRDPQIDVIAQRSLALTSEPAAEQVQHLYSQAVALDLRQQRSLAFAHLNQKGVLVLDAPAPQISGQLVDRYLFLKARNRL